jgi:dolichyl-phosphate-mannose-protein mannosyltransferase
MTKTGEPVATVGGEEGGRGAIVVDDNLAQDPNYPPGDSETHAQIGKIEPGRDIFAQEPIKEVKSHVQDNMNDEFLDKVVSTVVPVNGGAGTKQKASSVVDEIPPHDDTRMVNTQTESVKEDKQADPDSAGSGEVLKEHGPVIEEIAQADRVREELFHERDEGSLSVPESS